MYGLNSIAQRQYMWQDMRLIVGSIEGAWCVMGDFNAVMHPGERIGGEEV